jgi:hypothetical protein
MSESHQPTSDIGVRATLPERPRISPFDSFGHSITREANLIAYLVNPGSVDTEAERRDVQGAARRLGQQLIILDASSDRDIETSFATFVQRGAGALMVGAGAFLFSNRERLVSGA